MLEKFKEDVIRCYSAPNSFWQGVDVPGEALSNVIIYPAALCGAGSSADRGAH